MDLLTEEERKRLEYRMDKNPALREKINKKYEDYQLYIACIEGIGKILPILKYYAQDNSSVEFY